MEIFKQEDYKLPTKMDLVFLFQHEDATQIAPLPLTPSPQCLSLIPSPH